MDDLKESTPDNVVPIPGLDDAEPVAEESQQLDLSTAQSYVVIGRDKDGREFRAMSANMTLELLGAYVGTLQASLQMETAIAGMRKFVDMQRKEQAERRIITPRH